jgi:hypothetical protein
MVAEKKPSSKIAPAYFGPFDALLVRIAGKLRWDRAMALLKRREIDIRILWAENRFYDVSRRILKNQEGSLEDYVEEIVEWYKQFPYGRGYPWGCAMESVFRIFNIVLMFGALGKDYQSVISNVLRIEAHFILTNLEKKSQNNHYLFNLIGLLIAAKILKGGLRQSIEAINTYEELDRLFEIQFLPDGTNFEASSGYHFMVMEAIAILAVVDPLAKSLIFKQPWLQGALRFMNTLLDGEGDILQIGDDDSGSCLLPWDCQNLRKFQHQFVQDVFEINVCERWGNDFFPNFGLLTFRRDEVKFHFYGVRNRQDGKGGHAHNDNLAIALFMGGKPILTDSGSYSYVRRRNAFRSVDSHSVVRVSGVEPCPLDKGRFLLPDASLVKISGSRTGYWFGTHRSHGFPNLLVRRQLWIKDGRIIAKDNVSGCPKDRQIASIFILAPDVEVRLSEGSAVLCLNEVDFITLRCKSALTVKEHLISPAYGTTAQVRKIEIVWPEGVFSIIWELLWK